MCITLRPEAVYGERWRHQIRRCAGGIDVAYKVMGDGRSISSMYLDSYRISTCLTTCPSTATRSTTCSFRACRHLRQARHRTFRPIAGFGSLADRMDDIRAVMDAAGIERAALFGISEGGPLAILFAATYPTA